MTVEVLDLKYLKNKKSSGPPGKTKKIIYKGKRIRQVSDFSKAKQCGAAFSRNVNGKYKPKILYSTKMSK